MINVISYNVWFLPIFPLTLFSPLVSVYCLERLGSQLAYASGVLSRLDILMSSLLLAVSDVLSLTTIYIISSTVLVVLSSTG